MLVLIYVDDLLFVLEYENVMYSPYLKSMYLQWRKFSTERPIYYIIFVTCLLWTGSDVRV